MACNVAVPDQFNSDLVSRRAAYIPFPQAVPKKAVIERAGSSPCSFTCPAGIKAHGYVALARSGQYDKAFDLVLEATPLVGSLGRACYAPCEGECTRGSLEGPVPIRRVKRFVADHHYAGGRAPPPPPPSPQRQGGGRRRLRPGRAHRRLAARPRGHRVTVFEAAPQPGGMLRLAIPSYRLPTQVVDDDLSNLTGLGVDIRTGTRVEDLQELRAQGYDAILLATGTHGSAQLRVPGEDKAGVVPALRFLAQVKLGEQSDLGGRRVAVIGGGNVAIDAARTAARLGAAAVTMVSLESREEMPAHDFEVAEAQAEGIAVHNSWGVVELTGAEQVDGVRLRRCTAVFDADHRFNPSFDDSVTDTLGADVVIVAVGMFADTEGFALPTNRNRTLVADPGTLQTGVADVFAAGDTVTGPSMITKAVGQGRRAAFMIDRWLRGEALDAAEFDQRLPMVDKGDVLRRQTSHSRRDPLPALAPAAGAALGFAELEPGLSEEQLRSGTSRCLDCGVCSECHACVDVCPADAIHLDMREERVTADVGTVIVSTGFRLFPADAKPQYGFGRYRNVITGMQMDRLLAPTRPYNTVLRPGDGKVPDRIAFVMCTGSRDLTVGNPLCSKVCCMYSIKQNQLIMGALPLADVTVHYIDIRAVGKGYDEFFTQAADMGTQFVKGRVAEITEKPDGDLILRYEDIDGGGGVAEAEYDLVVLAVGIQPTGDAQRLFLDEELASDDYLYVAEVDEDVDPGRTSIPGVFVAGTASGAKDIPESILHAGAAVAQAAAHLERAGSAAAARRLASASSTGVSA